MTDVVAYPVAGADDAYGILGGNYYNYSNQLFIGTNLGESYAAVIRFDNVNIPQGVLVTAAYITFTAYTNVSNTSVNVIFQFVEADDQDAPTDYASAIGMNWCDSGDYIAWNNIAAWTDGTQYNSPSLVDQVQALVDRPGWASGQAMVFGIFDNSSDANACRTFSSIEYLAGAEKAELHISYEFLEEIEDSADAADLFVDNNFAGILDELDASEDMSSQLTAGLSISDSANASDTISLILYIYKNIADSLAAADSMEGQWLLSIVDSFFIWDDIQSQWTLSIEDELDASDSLTLYLLLRLTEYLQASDTISSNWTGTESLSDSANLTDSIIPQFLLSLTDSLNAADTMNPILVLMISDYLTMRDVLSAQASLTSEISDSLAAADSMVSQWMLSLIDSFDAADAVSQLKFIAETIEDSATISDALSSTGTFGLSIEETAQLVDLIQNGYDLSISDSLNAADTITSIATIYSTLADSMNAADALTVTLTAYLSISDNAVIVDAMSNNGILYATITEAAQLSVTMEIDDEVYECWVLSTPTFLPSVYSGFNFNSYTVFNNRIFAANSTGIYELTGDDDAGSDIHTGVQFQETDFGTAAKKRFRKGFLGVSGTTPVMSMEETDTGTKRTYAISEKGEVAAARDVVGKRWKLSVMDFDELDTIKLVPVVLTKRR
ncbi:MAG: hypothetical protein SVO01_00150 [Thermotogota bacterium]|nr:hypothetical protein [Thermotogota bacterium]